MIQISRLNRMAGRAALSPLHYRSISLILLLGASFSACSNESMYRAIQENRLQACEQIPIAQQAGCKAQYQTDYETYKRERDLIP